MKESGLNLHASRQKRGVQTHFELAIYLEHKLAERESPALREVAQYAAAYGPTERSRAERDVRRGGLRLGLEM